MAIESIQLRKLLCLIGAKPALRTRIMRRDILTQLSKDRGDDSEGGDFHVPFWADAKNHAAEIVDIGTQTTIRVAKHPGRKRLYPQLRDGFLKWWNEKRRWRNEAFKPLEYLVRGHWKVGDLGTVKVGGPLAIKIEGGPYRIVYPYFAEDPPLTEELVRLGLWLLSNALPTFPPEDLRILDVLRSRSFGMADVPLNGDEAEVFAAKYQEVVSRFAELSKEYPKAA